MYSTEIIEQALQAKVSHYLSSQTTYKEPELFPGSLKHEYYNGINFVYFESREKGSNWPMKRYHQLVFSELFFTCLYKDSNAIDQDKSYSIEDLKQKFTGFLSHYLKKMQEG